MHALVKHCNIYKPMDPQLSFFEENKHNLIDIQNPSETFKW